MSNGVKFGVYIILAIVGIFVALAILKTIVSAVLGLIIPLAIVAVIGLVIYNAVSRRCLGGGGRSLP